MTLRNAEDGAAITEMKKGLNKVLKKYFVNYDFRLDGYYVDLWIEDRYEEEYIMELLNTLQRKISGTAKREASCTALEAIQMKP